MANTHDALSRILRSIKGQEILPALTRSLSPSDLTTLLLHVMDIRVAQEGGARATQHAYQTNRFVKPGSVDQRQMLKVEQSLLGITPMHFHAIELAPVLPFGANQALAPINQKTILTTIRSLEIVADPTVALAFEAADRRQKTLRQHPRNTERVHLCTTHRVLRQQRFDKNPGFTPHFRAFAMCSAGRDEGSERFEQETLCEHLSVYIACLSRAAAEGKVGRITLAFSDVKIIETLSQMGILDRKQLQRKTQDPTFRPFTGTEIDLPSQVKNLDEVPSSTWARYGLGRAQDRLRRIAVPVAQKIRQQFPEVEIVFDLARVAGIGYYQDSCFKISAVNKRGETFPLADGGFTCWTERLLNSHKERLLTSGFGSELFCRNFLEEGLTG